MASGNAHDRATVIAAGVIAGYAGFRQWEGLNSGFYWLMAGGCLLNLMLSPDLDGHRSNSKRRWGILSWYWYPYEKLISHRSIFSHFPMLGSAIRLGYVSLPYQLWMRHEINWVLTIPVYLGLCVADTLHWIMDSCPVHFKRSNKRHY